MAAVDFTHYFLYTADAPVPPGDPGWTWQPHLIVGTLTRGVSPTLSQMSLTWRFGTTSRNYIGLSPDPMEYVAPIDLRGKYVLIECDELSIAWIGFVPDHAVVDWNYETDDEDAQRPVGGNQQFTAVGLEYFLGRQQVSGTSSRNADRSKRPYGYNCGNGDGRDVDRAKRGNREPPTDDPTDAFEVPGGDDAYDPLAFSFETAAIEWRADAIVKHLLAEHCPRDGDDDPAPIVYQLDDAAIPFLRWYKPTVKVEGRSLLQILDDVIDRRRGLVWWIETEVVEGEGEDPDTFVAKLKVNSANPTDTMLPPEMDPPEDPLPTVPANSNQQTIEDPAAYPTLEPIPIKYSGPRKYHRVRCRGARSTSTYSAVGAVVETGVDGYVFAHDVDGVFESDWSGADQDAYAAGVRPSLDAPNQAVYDAMDEKDQQKWNDRYRQSSRFERVFRYFSVDATSGNLQPIFEPSTGSIVGYLHPERRVLRVQRQTAMKTDYDYADATNPTKAATIENGEEFVRPFAMVYLPKGAGFVPTTLGEVVPGDETTSTDGGWRFLHNITSHAETGFPIGGSEEAVFEQKFSPDFSLTPISGEPGLILSAHGGMAHALMMGVSEEGFAPSKYSGGFAWGAILVTVTSEWENYCEAIWPNNAIDASPIEELLVQIGDRARFDWLAEGTVYDLNEHGHPKQVATAGALRDDRKLCEQIAKLAYNWYGTERAEMTLSFGSLEEPFGLGVLITTVATGAAQRTVNAVVTQITHDMHNGRTTIQCGFGELNFTGFA